MSQFDSLETNFIGGPLDGARSYVPPESNYQLSSPDLPGGTYVYCMGEKGPGYYWIEHR